MDNFNYSVPTKIYFGKGQIKHLTEMKEYGNKVLMVYGGGSIKRNGIYDAAIALLKEAEIEVVELSGVEPNPRIETVRKGAEICKAEGVDMILAVGGGSTIDCSKVIGGAAKYDGDAWDLVTNPLLIEASLPIFSILTLSATGSEMDAFAVISNMATNDKIGTASPLFKPVFSILDPEYTFSVPKRQTAAGTADIMSHTFENYFTNVEGAGIQGHLCEAVLKTLVEYAPIAMTDPENYDARANLMWASSLAINGLLSDGAGVAWTAHPIEHELSAYYDITHGEGLAIITPVWMETCMEKEPRTIADFAKFGRVVFGISGDDDEAVAKAAVAELRKFLFETLEIPSTLRAVGIDTKENFPIMAEKAAKGCRGSYVALTAEDIEAMLERMF
ncbi:MAG: iron-containing alcohol dehydrogenase [Firmicutes bacterium]|nr:iron-containing alcohol dehydrogenase [Bacillota bacterium]